MRHIKEAGKRYVSWSKIGLNQRSGKTYVCNISKTSGKTGRYSLLLQRSLHFFSFPDNVSGTILALGATSSQLLSLKTLQSLSQKIQLIKASNEKHGD